MNFEEHTIPLPKIYSIVKHYTHIKMIIFAILPKSSLEVKVFFVTS